MIQELMAACTSTLGHGGCYISYQLEDSGDRAVSCLCLAITRRGQVDLLAWGLAIWIRFSSFPTCSLFPTVVHTLESCLNGREIEIFEITIVRRRKVRRRPYSINYFKANLLERPEV
jgi:hypothetical protein